jgi:hypothetical protein
MFALQTCLPQYSAELCTTIHPQREMVRHVIATRKVIQTTQAEGAFLKGEDSVFFS